MAHPHRQREIFRVPTRLKNIGRPGQIESYTVGEQPAASVFRCLDQRFGDRQVGSLQIIVLATTTEKHKKASRISWSRLLALGCFCNHGV